MGCGISKPKSKSFTPVCNRPGNSAENQLEQETPSSEGEIDHKVPKALCSDQDNLDSDSSDLEQPETENAKNKFIRSTTKLGQLRRSKTFTEKPTEEREIVLEPAPSERKLFQQCVNATTAVTEDNLHLAHKLGLDKAYEQPPGNFIDISGADVLPVCDAKGQVTASEAVCHISFPVGNNQQGTATGFRVGTKPYIMTAAHVVKSIIDYGYRRLSIEHQHKETALQQDNVFATFNFLRHGTRSAVTLNYHFKPLVHFLDEETDIAVIELDCTEESAPKSCYSLLGPNRLEFDKFTLIGHTAGRPMALNTVDKIVDTNSEITRSDIEMVKVESAFRAGRHTSFEHPPYNVLSNRHRYLFHCKFSKGASGSPGVIVLDNDHIVVVTVLLFGYPNWYYDENVAHLIRASWPKEYCIEQGAKMTSVYDLMLEENPDLCREIFAQPLPSPNL